MTSGRVKLVIRTDFPILLPENTRKVLGQQGVQDVAGLAEALEERVCSRPASGEKQVFGISFNPDSDELILDVSSEKEP